MNSEMLGKPIESGTLGESEKYHSTHEMYTTFLYHRESNVTSQYLKTFVLCTNV